MTSPSPASTANRHPTAGQAGRKEVGGGSVVHKRPCPSGGLETYHLIESLHPATPPQLLMMGFGSEVSPGMHLFRSDLSDVPSRAQSRRPTRWGRPVRA